MAHALHGEPLVQDLTPRLDLVRPRARTTDLMPALAALAAEAPPAPARPMIGPYEVIGLLKAGGMGGVYVARHSRTGDRVALKVLEPAMACQPDLVRRLFGELDVSRRVGHHGLVTIRDRAISLDGRPYLVMELLDGENLGDLVGRGRIEIGAIAAIGAQVADAMAAMHERRIVHCDVKPDNVMVLYRHGLAGWPEVKVIDFGVVRFLDRQSDDTVAGTPAYMPPEQWAGDVEPRSDVYARGCTLYELLVGEAPFTGSLAAVMSQHTDRLPDPPSRRRTGIPVELEALVLRMLAKDPGMRPRMADVARVLTELAYAMPPGARIVLDDALAS